MAHINGSETIGLNRRVNMTYDISDLQPIPLDESILLSCGFQKHSTNPFWFRKKQICISLAGSVELISWDMQIFKIDVNIKFLHRLQNFYFELNNEELEINLKELTDKKD